MKKHELVIDLKTRAFKKPTKGSSRCTARDVEFLAAAIKQQLLNLVSALDVREVNIKFE